MTTLTRRQFIEKSSLGVGAALYLSRNPVALSSSPLGIPIGFQVWTIRESLMNDFKGTLTQIAEMGYKTVEMCSPPGYNFTPLVKMTAKDMRKAIDSTGLKCTSCHYNFRELRENLNDRMSFARELGLKQMIIASMGVNQNAPVTDWLNAADELNRLGERTMKEGIQLGYHNHDTEFKETDGVLIYDALMNRFDPELIKMQFQVSVISIGYKAATYFNKYPGRFISLHLSDWSTALGKSVPVGQGDINWEELFAAARTGGVKNLFVEMNRDAFQDSYTFLHNLKV